jgi:Zn-dependent metalloprotease
MVFGDTLPTGLDACAHELTHGVIFGTGDGGILNYHDQPGAINEALADIFGENVEAFTKGTNDWIIGKETVLGALRDMASPGNLKFGNNPYPSKMSQFYQLGPEQDHGGVHENSSIINRCYYLLAAGPRWSNWHSASREDFLSGHDSSPRPRNRSLLIVRHACVSSAEEDLWKELHSSPKTAEGV